MHLGTELLALCVYGPAVVLLHEAGHALFARAGGYRVTSFAIGLGPPLWSVYLREGVVLHLDRWLFAGGACTAIPLGPPTRRRAWFHGGGLLVQALLAAVLLVLPWGGLVDRIAQFNVLVALTNAVPWRMGPHASDGWHLLDALSGAHRAGTVLPQQEALRRMSEREEAAGSPLGATWCAVCLAWAAVQLGDSERARQLLDGQAAVATHTPWLDALYHLVDAEIHRVEARPLRSLAIYEEAEGIDALTDEGRALLTLGRARAWLDAGAPERARHHLAELAGTHGALATQATAVLLRVALNGSDSELEQAVWRVTRRLGDSWPDPLDTIDALMSAAATLEARGRVPAARSAHSAGRTLLHRTLRGLDEVSARQARMRLGLSSWHADARSEAPHADGPKERRSTDRI
jgi:hypothetical protein